MTVSLQPIANLTVPALQGYTVPLLASPTTIDSQDYLVTSSNPDIAATVAPQEFWTVSVSYTDPITPANSFTGSLTFQLLGNLTPNTVTEIANLTTDGYFANTG
jgi:hypothetical protein